MVDFSCALKLAMPISVLSAIREASQHHITVKGGKYLEAVADAETIVFDKTGTLTEAKPTVAPTSYHFNGMETGMNCSALQPAWRSISRTRWRRPSYSAAKERHLDTRGDAFQGAVYRRTRHRHDDRWKERVDYWKPSFRI